MAWGEALFGFVVPLLLCYLLCQEFGHRASRFPFEEGKQLYNIPDQDLLERISKEVVLHSTS
jgi:hypothetical protein